MSEKHKPDLSETSDYSRQLESLRNAYLASLPERRQQLLQAWQVFHRTRDTESRRRFYQEAHNLAGSGASFDHPEISRLASELQELIREHPIESDPASWLALQQSLDRLDAHLQSLQKP